MLILELPAPLQKVPGRQIDLLGDALPRLVDESNEIAADDVRANHDEALAALAGHGDDTLDTINAGNRTDGHGQAGIERKRHGGKALCRTAQTLACADQQRRAAHAFLNDANRQPFDVRTQHALQVVSLHG